MNPQEVLGQLQSLGNASMKKHHLKFGARDNVFGVKMGDIRALAKRIKQNHELGLALWATNNVDARFLAILILRPDALSVDDLSQMLRSESYTQVVDWLYSNVIKDFPEIDALRLDWMASDAVMCARVGWSLTSARVARNPDGLDLAALLDRIETEMPKAASEVQWTMNSTLAQIGIHFPEYRARAMNIGEKLGIYRDFPVSKGCTSPFAPIWIHAMVSRQG